MRQTNKKLLLSLQGETQSQPPIWLMRQAGRYLPEYRAIRAKGGSFLDLCFTPDLAIEVTLQPIQRFGFDAAIIFSDILVVPHALGQDARFADGSGPVLDALDGEVDLARLNMSGFLQRLAPVYEALAGTKAKLPPETTLIGFAGAPWTIACYMIEGGATRDFARIKSWAYGKTPAFEKLIDLLIEAIAQHAIAQVEAGAEVIQLFDSWAGALDHAGLLRWSLKPMQAIAQRIRTAHPDIPIIVFPRACGAGYLDFARMGFAQGLGLDPSVPLDWAWSQLQGGLALQGNLDPQLLVAGGDAMQEAVLNILAKLNRGPFIFNLGHGIVPETPPEHVEALVDLVRNWRG
jgi:uroporphyrinogen decarboxylase